MAPILARTFAGYLWNSTLAPRPYRLLQVRNARMTAMDGDFDELVHHRRSRCVNPGGEQRIADDRPIAFGNGDEFRQAWLDELGQVDTIQPGDLGGVRTHGGSRRRPGNERRDDIPRARREIVQPAEDGGRGELEIDLLARFAQRRLDSALARVDATAWQSELPGVRFQV